MKKISDNKFMKYFIPLVSILLIAFAGFGIMMLISPNAKALPKLLIGFAVIVLIIVLIALYIKYASDIYKQVKK